MVNPTYWKQIVQSNPILNDEVVVTQSVAGITVSMVPCEIKGLVCLEDFKSCRVRLITIHDRLKFSCLDSVEYIKLSKVINQLEDNRKSPFRVGSPRKHRGWISWMHLMVLRRKKKKKKTGGDSDLPLRIFYRDKKIQLNLRRVNFDIIFHRNSKQRIPPFFQKSWEWIPTRD